MTAWVAMLLLLPAAGDSPLNADDAVDRITIQNRLHFGQDSIAGERIALGQPDDYKPCIARLTHGELLLTAFHQHKRDGNKVMEQTLLFRSPDGGRTWTGPQSLDLLGREPYLTVLADGTLVTSCSYRGKDNKTRLEVIRWQPPVSK